MKDQEKTRANGSAKVEAANERTALLLIDVISDFDFEDGDRLFNNAAQVAGAIARLKQRARDEDMPVIYVNDNYGKWQEDFEKQVKRITETSTRGRQIAEMLIPAAEDYYVLKPQRSAFYETPLTVLLASMGVSTVIIAGFTTDICVLFTAHDAYMRGFHVVVPSDCSAAVEPEFHDTALRLIERVANADISPSSSLDLRTVTKQKEGARPAMRASTKTAD